MRTKKLTKKDRANLRSAKWLVFERSLMECLQLCDELREKSVTLEQRKRAGALKQRIRNAFSDEAVALGWKDASLPTCVGFPSNKARTRLSIEAV